MDIPAPAAETIAVHAMMGVPAPAAETITAFSVARAEALCFAQPPRRLKPSPGAWVRQPARPPRQPAHPELNWNDAPEALLTSARRGRPGCRSQAFRGERRLPGSVLQPLREEMDTVEGAPFSGAETASDGEEAPWACPACTFENAGALPACEMCGHSAASTQAQPAAEQPTPALEPLADGNASWPTLAAAADTAWDFAEVSSVGSSWLDVADLGELVGTEAADDFVIVTELGSVREPVGKQDPASTWAARAAARAPAVSAGGPARGPRPAGAATLLPAAAEGLGQGSDLADGWRGGARG